MFFFKRRGATLAIVAAATFANVSLSSAEYTDEGDQVIDGTRMHTIVYHDRGYAVFSNDCGSQKLTQAQLQAGAKPTQIMPCPRPQASAPSSPSAPRSKRQWAAVAAGLSDGILGIGAQVSVGLAKNYDTRAAAERAAVKECQKNISSCKAVAAWNSGCYYITVSDNADNVAWGSGQTAQDAYNACYQRVKGGNCKTDTIGACYPN